jgi:hypothetical protein
MCCSSFLKFAKEQGCFKGLLKDILEDFTLLFKGFLKDIFETFQNMFEGLFKASYYIQ